MDMDSMMGLEGGNNGAAASGLHDVENQPEKMEDIGAEMEILDRKISAIDDPNDETLPTLVKARRKLGRVMRLKRLDREREAILSGEDEGMFF